MEILYVVGVFFAVGFFQAGTDTGLIHPESTWGKVFLLSIFWPFTAWYFLGLWLGWRNR